MTSRVINDPSALGWEYDPDTGRWTWGGHSSSGGGGGGSFPEAPVDGEQYARQNASWSVVEHSEGGGGSDWKYYPDSYRFVHSGLGGYTSSEFWALAAEDLDPAGVNVVDQDLMINKITANRIGGPYLRITSPDISIGLDGQDNPGKLVVSQSAKAMFRNAFSFEHTVFGGINIPATDAERPDGFPYSADEKSIQYALTVSHETLGRTVEIDKEGIIRANQFTDMDGNPIGGGGIGDAPADGTIYGRQNSAWVAVPAGGGGGDLSAYYTKTESDSRYQAKGNYLVSSDLNSYATQTWVGQNYQAKGSYAASNHNHNGVYQPVGNYLTGESDPTVPAHVKSISTADINKWNNPPAAVSNDTWDDTLKRNASTTQNPSAPNYYTNSNTYTLGGAGGNGARIVSLDGSYYFHNSASAQIATISGDGSITAVGDVTAFSDARLKENIETLDGSKVYDMRGVSFTKDGRDGSGVIAQELLEVAPELVKEDGEYLSVAYGNLVGYLIEAVKELKAEVEELKRGDR